MTNFILIFVFLFLGIVFQNIKGFPVTIYKLLNKIVIYICLPALALYYIPKIKWSNELLFPIAILVDQPGSFVVLSTVGVLVATLYSSGNPNGFQITKKILLFPPFITFLIACVMNVIQVDFHEYAQFLFQKMGNGVTPLALLSVGLQLRFEPKSQHWKFLGLGLLYKFVLTPALIYLLYVVFL